VSIDYGATWQRAELDRPKNRYAWQNWWTSVMLPSQGYYELWVRATDSDGRMQPHTAGNWNPQGYGANPFHRVAVLVPT
jgi:sulfite oxidase